MSQIKSHIYLHPAGFDHNTGPGHPERADRLKICQDITQQFSEPKYQTCIKILQPPKAKIPDLLNAHDQDYIDDLIDINDQLKNSDKHIIYDSGDTILSAGSFDAASYAAGAVIQAVEDINHDKCRRAFCLNRPPGHHAEPNTAMGFCLLNSIFIGARYALDHTIFQNILILDFDVHHGNGTDTMTRRYADYKMNKTGHNKHSIFYISTHEWPLFPGTGHPKDNIPSVVLNATLEPGTSSKVFRTLYDDTIFPAIENFNPDLILLSAGFDAHYRDHISSSQLTDEDYHWLSDNLDHLSNKLCDGRIISVLEGGYDLIALEKCLTDHIRILSLAET